MKPHDLIAVPFFMAGFFFLLVSYALRADKENEMEYPRADIEVIGEDGRWARTWYYVQVISDDIDGVLFVGNGDDTSDRQFISENYTIKYTEE